MTNRRTFLTAAGAAVSCLALPLASIAHTAAPAAPAVAGPGTGNVEQWLLGKGKPTLTRADLAFIRSSHTQSLASAVDTCDAR